MTPRRLKQIGIALGVLIFLWGAAEIFLRRSDRIRGERLFDPVTEEQVDSIVIARQADTVHLVKRPTLWAVNGELASPNEIRDFFKQLADSSPPEIAAKGPAVHQRMGVDSVTGRVVRVFGGGQALVHLIVGARGPDFQSSFVRRPGDDRVYLRLGAFAGFVDRAPDDWREHRMAIVPPDSVARVDVLRHGRRYSLVRQDTSWTFADGTPANRSAVNRFLLKLNPVTATGFATSAETRSISFARPDLRLVVRNGRGDTLTHLLGDSMPSGYWVRHDSGGPVYRNGIWVADEIAPDDSTLRARGR